MGLTHAQMEALSGQLTAAAGSTVTLQVVEELRPGRILRATLTGAPPGWPRTVIVKGIADDERGIGQKSRAQFETELASLRFLQTVHAGRLAPGLIAWDRTTGVMALADLGGTSLSDSLTGRDRASARGGLVAFATLLGTLHHETAGREAAFTHYLTPVAAARPAAGRLFLRNQDLATVRSMVRRGQTTGALPPWGGDVEEELDRVVAALTDPGHFLAFTNGDPCPDNVMETDQGTRLVDFEVGAFRHALLDAAYFTLPFPNCWCWRPIPEDVVGAMLGAYRHALAPGPWSDGDRAAFDAGYAMCCAAWVVYLVGSRWDGGVFEQDRAHDLFTERQRLVDVLDRFGQSAAGPGVGGRTVPALVAWAAETGAVLRRRWADSGGGGLELDLDPYPAFAEPPATS